MTATEFWMANSSEPLWQLPAGGPPDKGFHPGVPPKVGEPSFSLRSLCSKKSSAKKARGLDVSGTWMVLCFAVAESNDTTKPFPLHLPGTGNSLGVVLRHSKSHQANTCV